MSRVLEAIDQDAALLDELRRKIWEYAELGLVEFKSSALLADTLEREGFSVTRGVAGMATAFVASYGTGGPVIALLGEYDALPNLSQQLTPVECPIQEGGAGHGCGHNLLGVGALGAALAVRRALAAQGQSGTVRFYGCPAEETVDGKAFMAKAGLFDDVDIAITWHPGDVNAVWAASSQAMNGVRFTFRGVAAHAAGRPEAGRSALDAVELMNVGVNFLREHVPSDVRIHYVITHGGEAPNVVPPFAQSWYYVRAPKRRLVEEVYARVCDVARGAALMTGTSVAIELMGGCWDMLPNHTVGERLLHNLKQIGAPRFTAEEIELAKALQATFPEGALAAALDRMKAKGYAVAAGERGAVLQEAVAGHWGKGETLPGSTDVSDVSHVVPTAQILTATAPVGTPGHSWQNVVAVGSGIGLKGMLYAAKVMAQTALDFIQDPELVAQAKAEFAAATAGEPYVPAVGELIAPPHVPADAPWRA